MNNVDSDRATALHVAAFTGNGGAVKTLLDHQVGGGSSVDVLFADLLVVFAWQSRFAVCCW